MAMKNISVIGAGTMGNGIAHVFAQNGFAVTLIDVSAAQIVDHTSILTLNSLVEDYKDNGGQIKVEGFENHKQLGHAATSTRVIKLS